MEIVPVFDCEVSRWFAGTQTDMPSGPLSQRGEFFAWPSPDGTTKYGHAQEYTTNRQAVEACAQLNALHPKELRVLAPWYWES